jgi:hypothetical protein
MQMVPNITRLLANSNIPDTLQMLQFKNNATACFKPHFRVLCLSHFRVTNKHRAAPAESVLCQCGEMSKSQKPLRALNFITRAVRRRIRAAGANMRDVSSDSRNDGILSPKDCHCIYLCQPRQFVLRITDCCV